MILRVALSNGATDTVDYFGLVRSDHTGSIIYLIRWHNVTHNESSYRDLMALAELAGSL